MSTPEVVKNGKKDFLNHPMQWLFRAIIIGLLTWAATTLYSVDKAVLLFDHRLTQLEHFHHSED